MRYASFLLALAALAGLASAETKIERVDRPWFRAGVGEVRRRPLELHFAGGKGLPDSITGFNVDKEVVVFARGEGAFEVVKMSGWAPDKVSVWIPTRLLRYEGYLQLRVRVKGVDSRVFSVPIKAAPKEPPEILYLEPRRIPITKNRKAVLLTFKVSPGDEWGFAKVRFGDRGASLGNVRLFKDGSALMTAWIPKDLLGVAGRYQVRVATRGGRSKAVEVVLGSPAPRLKDAKRTPLKHRPPAGSLKVSAEVMERRLALLVGIANTTRLSVKWTSIQRRQLALIAGLLKHRKMAEAGRRWKALAGSAKGRTPADVAATVRWLLRQGYLDAQQDLRAAATHVGLNNQKKAAVRRALQGVRAAMRKPPGFVVVPILDWETYRIARDGRMKWSLVLSYRKRLEEAQEELDDVGRELQFELQSAAQGHGASIQAMAALQKKWNDNANAIIRNLK